jgi:hypothetical protein
MGEIFGEAAQQCKLGGAGFVQVPGFGFGQSLSPVCHAIRSKTMWEMWEHLPSCGVDYSSATV